MKVTNACGSTNSNAAEVVVVCALPQITAHPSSTSVNSGGSTTLSVAATGTGLTYQWYLGQKGDTSNPIVGATQSTLSTGPLSVATSFWVRVTGSCGTADSNAATVSISVCNLPSIATQPADVNIQPGKSTTLSIVASGYTQIRWYRGLPPDRTFQASTTTTLFTGPLNATTTYWVELTNSCGATQSRTVTVTVGTPCTQPVITTQPLSMNLQKGQTATLSVIATGTSLTYQWFQGDTGVITTPVGTNSSTFTTPALSKTTKYWVRVSNACGTASSTTATMNVQGGRRRALRH